MAGDTEIRNAPVVGSPVAQGDRGGGSEVEVTTLVRIMAGVAAYGCGIIDSRSLVPSGELIVFSRPVFENQIPATVVTFVAETGPEPCFGFLTAESPSRNNG